MKTGLEHIIVPSRPAPRKETRKKAAADDSSVKPRRSPRARLNTIPSRDELALLVDKAKQAFQRGMIWDRGAIINLVL